jgi:hypothetical protein
MDRRAFLRRSAAVPLLLGGGLLFGQEVPPKPGWFSEALDRMKREGVRGIVIVVPEPAVDRAALGRAIWARVRHGSAVAHGLFLQSVFVFLTPTLAQRHLGKSLAAWDRILLASDGAPLRTDRVSLKTFREDPEFVASFTPLVYGEGNDLLSDRDESAWAKGTVEVHDALDHLDDPDILRRKKARDLIRARVHSLLPCLLRRAMDPSASQGAMELIEAHYQGLLLLETDPWSASRLRGMNEGAGTLLTRQLPYGVQLPDRIDGGCCQSIEEPPEGESLSEAEWQQFNRGSVMVCGLGIVRELTYSFVKFLSQ